VIDGENENGEMACKIWPEHDKMNWEVDFHVMVMHIEMSS